MFSTKAEAVQFVNDNAVKVTVEVGGVSQTFFVGPKKDQGDGKSAGWYAGEKVTIATGDRLQIGLNITVIKSKALS